MQTDDSAWQKPKKKKRAVRRKKKTKETVADEPDEEETVADEPDEEETVADEPDEEETVADEPDEEETVADEIPMAIEIPMAEEIDLGKTNWERESNYLKQFFTKPKAPRSQYDPPGMYLWGAILFLLGFFIMTIGAEGIVMGLIAMVLGTLFIIKGLNISEKEKKYQRNMRKWYRMNPSALFSRIEATEKQVAASSYQNLGIIKNANPNEGGIVRPPAYCYGPHFSFDDFSRIDRTGWGKGAGYVKYCNLRGMAGWYARKYDMMVVQFTVNQLLVYKCIFDVLEMTKTMEESYEWNYKHVVGINITGDEKEKNLGGGFALSGTKYLTISAASGEKIRIILGASTKQLAGGKTQRATIGGSERIFSVANSAMTNIRQAIRDKAG